MELPPGFLEDLASRFSEDPDTLQALVVPVVRELGRRIITQSPLSTTFGATLQQLGSLVALKPFALALSRHPDWVPEPLQPGGPLTGREMQTRSLLGPFLSVTPILDRFLRPMPDVLEQCFSDLEQRRKGDVENAIVSIRTAMHAASDALQRIFEGLLRQQEIRPAVVRFLGGLYSLPVADHQAVHCLLGHPPLQLRVSRATWSAKRCGPMSPSAPLPAGAST